VRRQTRCQPWVLELGCGDCCQASHFFAAADAQVVAVDLSAEAHSVAIERTAGLPTVTVCRADMTRLSEAELPRKVYDVVCFFYSLHHIPLALLPETLASACAMLAPGGILAVAALLHSAVAEEEADSAVIPDPLLHRDALTNDAHKPLSAVLHGMHLSFLNPVTFHSMLECAGLADIECGMRGNLYKNEFPCRRGYFIARKK